MRDIIWATTAARLHSLRMAFTEHSAAATALLSIEAREGGRARLEAAVAQRKASASMIQVLPLLGDITQRGGFYGTSADLYGKAFSQSVADPAVAAIVMEIDSPGGEVHGVDELASRIRSARGVKPIVASINTVAASAAYWIAAQADEIIASPSSEVGSIGVFSVFEDWSRAIDQQGVTLTLISAGEGKGLDQPGLAMTDELRGEIQGRVDSYYAMFVAAASKGRGVREAKVRDTWKARMVGASEGVDLGMADSVGTIDDAIARAGVLSRKRGATRAEVDVEVEARIRQRARA
jgi:signal peptide peptidase SppA